MASSTSDFKRGGSTLKLRVLLVATATTRQNAIAELDMATIG